MRVTCLGPEGSYSHIAARRIFSDAEICFGKDFESVFAACEQGKSDYAVVPYENSVEGCVNLCLDLLTATPLIIVAEHNLPLDHRVFTQEGSGVIRRVYSHPQALGQCREHLRAMFPDAEIVPSASTAEAMTQIDAHTAAVASATNAREGLVMSEPVSDREQNVTRFVVLSRPDARRVRQEQTKLSIVFEVEHKPGGLIKALTVLDRYGINMTGIQSRPHKSVLGRYIFFVDAEGSLLDGNVQNALTELKDLCQFYKFLGAY